MFFAVVFTIAFTILGAGGAQAGTLVSELALKSDVTVSGPRVRLADVLDLPAVSDLSPWLGDTVLGNAPRVGQISLLSRREVEHALRRVRLEQGLAIRWSGAQAVRIRAAQQTLAAGIVAERLRQGLMQALEPRAKVAAVDLASTAQDVALPLGEVSLVMRSLAHERLAPRMPVWADVSVDGVFYRSVSLVFAVQAEALPTDDRVVRGAVVTLQVTQGGVVLETKAVVQQDAMVGQIVKVRLEHGTELLLAKVRSAARVEME
jgi:hypothetical protein